MRVLFILTIMFFASCQQNETVVQSDVIPDIDAEEDIVIKFVYDNRQYDFKFINQISENNLLNPELITEFLQNVPQKTERLRFAHDINKVYLFDNMDELRSFQRYWHENIEHFVPNYRAIMKKAEAELDRRERDNSTRSGFKEWLVFYKGCNSDNPFMYGAKNISGSDFIDTEVPGSEWCSWKYEQNRLKNVPLGDGTWNDVISKISWDLLDDPILGPWSSSGKYELAVFKHSNFPGAPCEREIIDFPYPIGSSNCLNSEYW